MGIWKWDLGRWHCKSQCKNVCSPQTVSGCRRQLGVSAQPGWGRPGGTSPSSPSRCTSRWSRRAWPRWPSPSAGQTAGCKATPCRWLEAPEDDMCQMNRINTSLFESKVRSKVDLWCRLRLAIINQSNNFVIVNADFKSGGWYPICWPFKKPDCLSLRLILVSRCECFRSQVCMLVSFVSMRQSS